VAADHIGATNGTGSGSISYFYEARGTFAQPRVATITVSGQVFTLTQSGIAPVFSVAPTTVDVGPGIGTTVLQVTANTLDAVWTATTSTSWISVPASGGVGAVTVGLSRNASHLPRAGSLTIAGINVAVTQLGNAIPGEPTDLGAAVLHGQARFEWSPPQTGGDATTYQLEAGLSPGAASAVFNTTDGTPAFVLSGVPAGVFYLRVRGRNEYGLGPASEEYKLTVTAAGTNQPGPPRNVVATITSATISGSRLSMAWDPPAPVGSLDGYVLEVGSATNSSDLVVLPLGLATTFGYDPLPSGYYFLRVRALNGAGAGAPSPEILITSGGVPSPPGAPRLLPSVVSGAGESELVGAPERWCPLRYRLEVGSSPGLSNLAVVETPLQRRQWGSPECQ
jgi:hypothetical protein